MNLRIAFTGFVFFSSAVFAPGALAQGWSPTFANGPTDGQVNAYVTYNNQLYAGGTFTIIDGVPAQYIARWTGTQWTALPGDPLPNPTEALAVYNGVLFAGGPFVVEEDCPNPPCQIPPPRLIAQYTQTGWVLDPKEAAAGRVADLEVYDGSLFVGGHIVGVDTVVDSPHLVKYTNGVWEGVGNGLNGAGHPGLGADGVYDLLTVDRSVIAPLDELGGRVLCVAGTYQSADTANPVPGTRSIAHWSTIGGWEAIGCGLPSPGFGIPPSLQALAVFKGKLHVGGGFYSIGCNSTQVSHLASWDGSDWSSVSATGITGSSAYVASLTVLGTKTLYVGGYFTQAGGLACSSFARWDGLAFTPLSPTGADGGGVVDGQVSCLLARTGDVAVGGFFTQVYVHQGTPTASNGAALWRP
jgi:trimeric autotransporter adhesin